MASTKSAHIGVLILFGLARLLVISASLTEETKKPNILLIVTDDQDVALHGMFPMTKTRKLLGDAGVTMTNAFTSSPLCCPARGSILTGQYAHNHGIHNNSVSGNCYGHRWRSQKEPHAMPVLLQQGGYRNFYAGKYLNQYEGQSIPPGWHDFHGLHGNSQYYNFTLRENDKNVTYTRGEYLTDLLLNLTIRFLDDHFEGEHGEKPFFAFVAPPAPHAPFTPAARHRGEFAGLKALKTPNFNRVSGPLDKHWLVASGRSLPEHTLSIMDSYFQQRWETLLAVDDLVSNVANHLDSLGHLDDTYIVYTSDNGYHIGQFAQPFDKRQPYETDIRVPLLVRGPRVPSGVQLAAPVSLIDLLPTFLEWAQLPPSPPGTVIDGLSFNVYLMNTPNYDPLLDIQYHRSLLVQHWGEGNDQTYNGECPWQRKDRLAQCTREADCHCQDSWNNTYACVRHFRFSVDRLYCEFKDEENFVEAYDLVDDPYQMANLGYELLPIERAFYSLALSNLTRCSGSTCADINI